MGTGNPVGMEGKADIMQGLYIYKKRCNECGSGNLDLIDAACLYNDY
jgi:hypothetical protein